MHILLGTTSDIGNWALDIYGVTMIFSLDDPAFDMIYHHKNLLATFGSKLFSNVEILQEVLQTIVKTKSRNDIDEEKDCIRLMDLLRRITQKGGGWGGRVAEKVNRGSNITCPRSRDIMGTIASR